MRIKILSLGFVIWLIIGFGISILYSTELPKVEWEYIKGGQGIAIIQGVTFNEVWEGVQDVLFFQKFKVKGQLSRMTHEIISIEKDSGLITVVGYSGSTRAYHLKISIRKKDNYIEMKTQCNTAWKKKATIRFFQLLEEGLEGEKE